MGKHSTHLNVMQEGYFPGMFIKNFCMSPSLLTMLPPPSSSWMLLLTQVFVPSDFRRENNETYTVLSLLSFTYMSCFSQFFPLSLLFWIGLQCIAAQRHSTCFLCGVWGKDTENNQMSHAKSLKNFISEMTNRVGHSKRAENNGWDREGGLNSSVLPPLTARQRDFLLHSVETD